MSYSASLQLLLCFEFGACDPNLFAVGYFGNADLPPRTALGPVVLGDFDDDHVAAVRRFGAPERLFELGDRGDFLADRPHRLGMFGEVDPDHSFVTGGVKQVVELLAAGVDLESVDDCKAAVVADDE